MVQAVFKKIKIMTALEYGKENFGEFSLNDTKNNIYVFADEHQSDDTINTIPDPVFYLSEIIIYSSAAQTYMWNPIGEKIPDYVYYYITSTNVIPYKDLGEQWVYYNNMWYHKKVFEIEGKLFAAIETYLLNEVIVKSEPKHKIKKPVLGIITDIMREKQLSVVLFISSDGVQLDSAYIKIDKIFQNEIIFFIERNNNQTLNNVFGTVIRVKAGSNVGTSTHFPDKQIGEVFKNFKIDVSRKIIADVFFEYLDDQGSVIYAIKKYFFNTEKLVSIPIKLSLKGVSLACESLANGFRKIKYEDSSWQYYDENGKPLEKTNLLLPGINLFENNGKSKNTMDKSHYQKATKGIVSKLDDISKEIKKLTKEYSFLKIIFGWVSDFLDYIADFIKNPMETFREIGKQHFIAINAFIVGIINGILDAIAGILDLIALIADVIEEVHSFSLKASGSSGVVFSLFFEILENIAEAFLGLFTKENFIAILQFFKDAFIFLFELPALIKNWLKETDGPTITIDKVGYYLGFIIGIVAEMAAEVLATGGAATIAEAFSKVGQDIVQLFKGAKQLGKTAIRTLKVSIEKISALFRYISEKIKNLKPFFEDFWSWIKGLFEKGKDFLSVFSKSTRETYERLGIEIKKARKSPVIGSAGGAIKTLLEEGKYALMKDGKEIFRGTQKEVEELAEKLKGMSDEAAEKYLDDLAESIKSIKEGKLPSKANRKLRKLADEFLASIPNQEIKKVLFVLFNLKERFFMVKVIKG